MTPRTRTFYDPNVDNVRYTFLHNEVAQMIHKHNKLNDEIIEIQRAMSEYRPKWYRHDRFAVPRTPVVGSGYYHHQECPTHCRERRRDRRVNIEVDCECRASRPGYAQRRSRQARRNRAFVDDLYEEVEIYPDSDLGAHFHRYEWEPTRVLYVD